MNRASIRHGAVLVAAFLAVATFAASVHPAAAEDPASDDDRGERIASDLASLRRSPFSLTDPSHAFALTQRLIDLDDPRADDGLRALLADASTPDAVLRQIVIAAVIEPERRLLRDVLKRLARERGSAFDDSLDATFRANSDADLVHRLAEFANDTTAPSSFRAEAARMLGRTGKPQALDPLVELWRSPDPDVRRFAASSFARILPAGFTSPDAAQTALDGMRERGASYWDLLSDLLRAREAPAPLSSSVLGAELRALAQALLDRATLDQVLELYLNSSEAELRRAGVRRVAEFPFATLSDATERAAARLRAADACLLRLQQDDDALVRELAYTALAPLVDALRQRGKPLSDDVYAAVVRHASLDADLPVAVRRSAIRLLGDLGDPRGLEPLQRTYGRLGDADHETRIAILDAIDRIAPGQSLGWLIERVRGETDADVASRIIFFLGASEDPAAVQPLRDLLRNHPDSNVHWKAARELGDLWKKREFPDARAALLDVGLVDEAYQVRVIAATALSYGGAVDTDRRRVIEALKGRVENDPEKKVRRQAAQSILDLDEKNAVQNLVRAFGDDEIWELYRKKVIDDAQARGSPERALGDAETLVARGEPMLVNRAFELLAGVAMAREASEPGAAFWVIGSSDSPQRGVVRERLARLLIEAGRPREALKWLDELLAAPRRGNDPYERWQVMAAQALRLRAGPGDLDRGRGLLRQALDAPGIANDLRGRALFALAETLLDAGRPSLALDTLSPDATKRAADAKALAAADAAALKALRARVDTAYAEQGARLAGLVAQGFGATPNAAAREQWAKSGPVAARHLVTALGAERDVQRVLIGLRAAAHLTGQSFATEQRPETTYETLAPEVQKALDALRQVAARSEK